MSAALVGGWKEGLRLPVACQIRRSRGGLVQSPGTQLLPAPAPDTAVLHYWCAPHDRMDSPAVFFSAPTHPHTSVLALLRWKAHSLLRKTQSFISLPENFINLLMVNGKKAKSSTLFHEARFFSTIP
jgi:hypothetical protein